jgi:uncharacterized protein
MGRVTPDRGAACDGDGVETGALTSLVDRALALAWRRDSTIHGDDHWRCVAATGLALAAGATQIDRTLVFCFGLLHDTRRLTDGLDVEHGSRAASYARELRDEGLLPLDEMRFALFAEALEHHPNGLVSADATTGTCWDADRLHLPRVSIRPRPDLFSTRAAHGEEPLAAAARLRAGGPPAWDVLVSAVAAPAH